MSQSTSYVSFVLIISILYSSVILCSVRARTTGQRESNPLSHFTQFLRALYAHPQDATTTTTVSSYGEMANDIPLMTGTAPDVGVMMPILRKRGIRYCGSFLADALALACRSSSYKSIFDKRSGSDKDRRSEGEAESGVQTDSWPFISADKAHQMVSNENSHFQRVARGVHDECCIKGCSFNELTSYCS